MSAPLSAKPIPFPAEKIQALCGGLAHYRALAKAGSRRDGRQRVLLKEEREERAKAAAVLAQRREMA